MKYANFPEYIISYKELNTTERLLMGIIYSLSVMSGDCFASNEYFAKMLCVSTRTISTSLSSLKREDLIESHFINGTRKIFLTEKFKSKIEE